MPVRGALDREPASEWSAGAVVELEAVQNWKVWLCTLWRGGVAEARVKVLVGTVLTMAGVRGLATGGAEDTEKKHLGVGEGRGTGIEQ